MTNLFFHFSAIQVFVPLFSSFLIALVRNKIFALWLFRVTSIISLAISCFLFLQVYSLSSLTYNFGNFSVYTGIIFRIDYLNSPILLLANILLTSASLLIFRKKDNFDHFTYSLILISYTGIFGILLTGDLFNLYVFLEIYSISSCALFAINKDKNGFIAAFHYLIIGTIAATLILLSIGFLLAASGNLNMENIQSQINGQYGSKIIMASCIIFAIATICKATVFPLHFWALQAYTNANSKILLLLGSISSNIGFYILLRFAYFVVDYQKFFIDYNIQEFLQITGILSILYGSIFAFLSQDLRQIIIFSGIASAGCFAILFSIPESDAFQYGVIYNLTDAILKIAMIGIVIIKEEYGSMKQLGMSSKTLSFLVVINILSSLGLPITMGFFNKIHLLRITLYSASSFIFLIMLFASIFAVSYHYRMIQNLFFGDITIQHKKILPDKRFIFFVAIFTLLSYVLLICNGSLLNYYSKITDIIFIATDGS